MRPKSVLLQGGNEVTVRTNFDVDSEAEGRDFWMDIIDDGRLTGT